jgi:AraC-like DNA-binding protein
VRYFENPCSGSLGNYAECVWSLQCSTKTTVLPDGCADLFVSESGKVYLSGVKSRSHRQSDSLGNHLRGIRLTAGAIPLFFGIPGSELCDQIVLLAELDSPAARCLTLIAMDGTSSSNRLGKIMSKLEEACQHRVPDQRLLLALSQVETKAVRDVASCLGMTERGLHRLFRSEIGLPPSTVKRIRRVQRTIDYMRQPRVSLSMADLALEQGFFDQAHMHHELKDLTGLSPIALRNSLVSQ